MRQFAWRQLREAIAHAAAGGQALYVPAPDPGRSGAAYARLFDGDFTRRVATARRLGVRVVLNERGDGTPDYVILVGEPLRRAIAEAEPWVAGDGAAAAGRTRLAAAEARDLAERLRRAAAGLPSARTYREMCEVIAAIFTADGEPTTPGQVWNYSPSGELWEIPGWYHEAVAYIRWMLMRRALPARVPAPPEYPDPTPTKPEGNSQMRFRKKPIEVQAWRNVVTSGPMPAWALAATRPLPDARLAVDTLEGTMVAEHGDWLIRGVKGEVYPIKEDGGTVLHDCASLADAERLRDNVAAVVRGVARSHVEWAARVPPSQGPGPTAKGT